MQGAISIGTTRSANLFVYNTSKKTPLTLTSITIEGPQAGDFTVSPASVAAWLNAPIPANQNAAANLGVTFTAHAEGMSAGALRLVSNAGTALVSLAGQTLPDRPIISVAAGPLSFIPTSAFDTLTVGNQGGQPLSIGSITIGGANPGAFQFVAANRGLSNCFAGVLIGAHAFCYLGVGVAPGAVAPANAQLLIQSNDPQQPLTSIELTLQP